jgi:hypothetical protein
MNTPSTTGQQASPTPTSTAGAEPPRVPPFLWRTSTPAPCSALQRFVQENEPAGADEVGFRDGLQAVVDEVWHDARAAAPVQIDELLHELDAFATRYDVYEYGLPNFNADDRTPLSDMREIVRKWMASL